MLTKTTRLLALTLALGLLAIDRSVTQPAEPTDHPNTTPLDHSVCERPMHSGMCFGYFPRYYYDRVGMTCKEFVYGGCQSNGNNFATFELCMEMCGPP